MFFSTFPSITPQLFLQARLIIPTISPVGIGFSPAFGAVASASSAPGCSSVSRTVHDSFRNYETDVKNVAALGLDFYRFSISWSRLIPTGVISEGISEAGLDYYHKLLNKLGN